MDDSARLFAAFALAFAITLALTPLARRLALRTAFLDHPVSYKGHAAPTPYLGGIAVVAGALIAAALFGNSAAGFGALVACVLALHLTGTLDDRVNLNVLLRLGVQVVVAYGIWAAGLGWDVFGAESLNFALTMVWVVGLVNAFNLMDNLDGAASSVAAVSAAGAGILAAAEGSVAAGAIALATAGACAGFLPYNLAKPSKIFLGDGGSMPVGLLVAVAVMAVPASGHAFYALLALAPLAGLPILDTTLVVISRWRRGAGVLSGARDHMTHRLHGMLGSPLRVAACLAGLQAALSVVGMALHQLSEVTIVAASCGYLLIGVGAMIVLENLYQPADVPPEVRRTQPAVGRPWSRRRATAASESSA
jgi:UDP-GlcNAc:undecaprenyl-phosphate GlcNAc-1-phosphate transferase